MSPMPAHLFDETDVPAVCATDLGAGLALWIARERQGIVLVGSEPFAMPAAIDAAVIAQSAHPSLGLAVLLRMRCLTAALASRRFKGLTRPENASRLRHLVEIAACSRLNARWGLSANRLIWALAAAEARDEPAKREAA